MKRAGTRLAAKLHEQTVCAQQGRGVDKADLEQMHKNEEKEGKRRVREAHRRKINKQAAGENPRY